MFVSQLGRLTRFIHGPLRCSIAGNASMVRRCPVVRRIQHVGTQPNPLQLALTVTNSSGHVPVTAANVYHRGHHVMLDVTNAVIKDPGSVGKTGKELVNAMAIAAREAGANVLMTHIEVFDGTGSPPGFAAVVLLDESHITAHCYSEMGLIAIDAFTCGEKIPASTERVAEHIAKHVKGVFPDAILVFGSMRRFETFDVAAYLKEYYGGDAVSTDNKNLLDFFHRAYKTVASKHQAAHCRLLEVGGGPTLFQLLSASACASEIVFTDLLRSNVEHVRKQVWEAKQGASGAVEAEWGVYADYVAGLEGSDSSPLLRLCQKITACQPLDINDCTKSFPVESFDVISACFVFEASGEPVSSGIPGRGWKDHLSNVAHLLKPDGHIVLAIGVGHPGIVTEGGRQLSTPKISFDDVEAALLALNFTDLDAQVIPCEDKSCGFGDFVALTAKKCAAAHGANKHRQARHNMVAEYTRHTYRHFNSASLIEAADAYRTLIEGGGKMFLTLAGAMSTSEIGVTLAEMIRAGKVHAISCTGANLEEDFYHLLAHNSYKRIPDWRGLSKEAEARLVAEGWNRVTDTCIPEEAFRAVAEPLLALLEEACKKGEKLAPHELFYTLIRHGTLQSQYQIDMCNSWLIAAAEKNLPIVVPGFEDSTLGNVIVSRKIRGSLSDYPIRSGLEQMEDLVKWYLENQSNHDIGFFQIGGGIAGDFPVCAVPLIRQDLGQEDCKLWSFFCQVSDGSTSYGGYSAAPPNEKITWGKLSPSTPSFIVESDATIVWPLMCSLVLAD